MDTRIASYGQAGLSNSAVRAAPLGNINHMCMHARVCVVCMHACVCVCDHYSSGSTVSCFSQ